jgi:hypothetical protein
VPFPPVEGTASNNVAGCWQGNRREADVAIRDEGCTVAVLEFLAMAEIGLSGRQERTMMERNGRQWSVAQRGPGRDEREPARIGERGLGGEETVLRRGCGVEVTNFLCFVILGMSR